MVPWKFVELRCNSHLIQKMFVAYFMSKTLCVNIACNRKMVRYRTSPRILQSNKTDRKLLTAGVYCSSLKGPAPNLRCPWWSPAIPITAPLWSPIGCHLRQPWQQHLDLHRPEPEIPHWTPPVAPVVASHPVELGPPRCDGCNPGGQLHHRGDGCRLVQRISRALPASCQHLCYLLPSHPGLMSFNSDLLQTRALQQKQNATQCPTYIIFNFL